MAEMTLLQMTQDILSSLDSYEVNSISDTTESLQVARIIKNKYYDIVSRGGLPEHDQLFQLLPSNDVTMPTLMFVPDGVSKIEWVKYFDTNPADGATSQTSQFGSFSHNLNLDLPANPSWTTTSATSVLVGLGSKTFIVASSTLNVKVSQNFTATSGTNILIGTVTSYSGTTLVVNVTVAIGSGTFSSWIINGGVVSGAPPGYVYVTVIPIDQFLDLVNRFNPADSNVSSFTFTEGGENFTFYYKNNIQPRYCTILSNNFIIFDAFDNTQDSTLQSSKTLCMGHVVPTFNFTDSSIPDLEDNKFPLLLNEAKALAFFELKQQEHPRADKEIKRQWSSVQRGKSISNKPSYFDQLANFGRVPRTGGFSSGGYGAYKWMRQAGP